MNMISRYIFIWIFLVLQTGCSSAPTASDTALEGGSGVNSVTPLALSDQHLELVITDLVSAMIQVNELSPFTTTLQVSRPVGRFGVKLLQALESAGYGLQQVSADQGVNYLSYANRVTLNEAGKVTDFVISVGGISIRREFDLVNNRIVPVSLMYIKGSTSLSNIVLNEDIFVQQGGEIKFESGVELEAPDATVVTSERRDINGQSGDQSNAIAQRTALLLARNNMFDASNTLLAASKSEYTPLRKTQLTYADASLQLGRGNKSAVRILVDNYQSTTDVFFISSCLSGSADTAELPMQRSNRVKEEFVLHGIPPAAVVEEGCEPSAYRQGRVIPLSVAVIQARRDEPSPILASNGLPEAFPNRPLVMTIPYGAGGATDFQARIVTMLAGQEDMLGQPVLIVNKPGSGGQSGWSWFANTASTSGYDIASYNVPHFIAQSIKFETPYNIDTLEPLGNWGADPAVLVVPSESPIKSLREFIIFARNNPGKLTVSGAGLFVGHHIAALQLEKATRIDLNYTTAKGGADALRQVVNGTVMSGFNNMSDAFRMGDKIRILAIADLERHSVIPAVPTFLEQDVNVDNSSVNYRGLMVPKGTPPGIVELLSERALAMFNAPEVVQKLAEGGSPLKVMSRDEVLTMWLERQRYLEELLKEL